MSYQESLIAEHLRRITVDDYEYGDEVDFQKRALHLIATVITQISSGVQLALESEENFDTIYGERTIGDRDSWLLLQTILKKLAEEHAISLKNETQILTTITEYFT